MSAVAVYSLQKVQYNRAFFPDADIIDSVSIAVSSVLAICSSGLSHASTCAVVGFISHCRCTNVIRRTVCLHMYLHFVRMRLAVPGYCEVRNHLSSLPHMEFRLSYVCASSGVNIHAFARVTLLSFISVFEVRHERLYSIV